MDMVPNLPAELFELFDSVSVSSPNDNNLLIHNLLDGRYISILFTERRAAVNGTIYENINTFRDGGITYVDAGQVADIVGIFTETVTHENGSVSMRLYEEGSLLTTEELFVTYFPKEEPAEEFADLVEEEEPDLKRIFILCREPSPDAEDSALELLQNYRMGYTMFLEADASVTNLLAARAGGDYGILADSSGEDMVAELNRINAAYRKVTSYQTHFTMTTGDYVSDSLLEAAGYCPVGVDFVVDSSVNAETMFADMLGYLGENDYCVLLLEDCPQTAQVLLLIDKINREQFITSNLGG